MTPPSRTLVEPIIFLSRLLNEHEKRYRAGSCLSRMGNACLMQVLQMANLATLLILETGDYLPNSSDLRQGQQISLRYVENYIPRCQSSFPLLNGLSSPNRESHPNCRTLYAVLYRRTGCARTLAYNSTQAPNKVKFIPFSYHRTFPTRVNVRINFIYSRRLDLKYPEREPARRLHQSAFLVGKRDKVKSSHFPMSPGAADKSIFG
jgi:hypothetical protein